MHHARNTTTFDRFELLLFLPKEHVSIFVLAFCILCFLGNQSPESEEEEEENHWIQTCWRYFEYELHTYSYEFIKNQAGYFDQIGMKATKNINHELSVYEWSVPGYFEPKFLKLYFDRLMWWAPDVSLACPGCASMTPASATKKFTE